MKKRYLGNGVYVEVNEDGFTLTTENGIKVTNTIMLEPAVAEALVFYIEEKSRLEEEQG